MNYPSLVSFISSQTLQQPKKPFRASLSVKTTKRDQREPTKLPLHLRKSWKWQILVGWTRSRANFTGKIENLHAM